VVLDSKKWHAQRPTHLVGGRLYCGGEDRHEQVEKVTGYARRVAALVEVPEEMVQPLLVVHCSPVAGGFLQARVSGWDGPVHVLGPDWLVPTLATAPGAADPRRAATLAQLVARALPPYSGGA
jgi:hypothetical protein